MTGRFIAGVVITITLAATLAGQNAQEIYQRGLVQEQAAGNLKEAIELYREAAQKAGKDRALAARALLRVAESQEKLGQQPEAADVYAELLRTYPEQRDQARTAQTKLAALRTTQPASLQGARVDVSAVTGPLFESYCVRCHNPANKAGGFDPGSLNATNVSENTGVWENILRRLQARRDPPTGLPRPDEATYRSVVSKLELALDRAYPANGPSATAARVTDTELAERIATLIWGGTPDAQLLDTAKRGRLRDAKTLEEEVRRMLRDPRSDHLIANFFERFLSLDSLDNAKRDPTLFPDFDSNLLQSMKTETRLFLESQLRENHGALDLWTANYTFLNERMARHYGVPGVSGNEFRRVQWPDTNRAGILGQASFLTLSSFASRTSPTQRGRYVFSKFLGMDAPPPPANVPPLSETPEAAARPMRDRLAAHKVNPGCVNCHNNFDPLGLALENFNAVGQWRNVDAGASVDASGTFIDGSKFNNPAEFRAGLLKYRDAYYSNITQQLLAYALGRTGRSAKLYDYEMPSARAIVRAASSNDYRWSSIITGILGSAPFQMKTLVP